ncbi:uncharacterized protein LOC117597866 isoform X3 [Pangasianodon hypophthalmus]|uniref:uncharacterized protein LOC117597866 isoform X3 n=1 Tax=Pangasianodon hypophthalmus TaxID=310915 RepID=UPI0023075CE8|nr:uncharacterized protein LOC117597866 isoform X3 [Pangasianodon hypophthalmus]
MAHALKVQAEIHQVPEYQVTAEELEGISLTQTDPDFTRGINPDEFARGSGSDSLADDLDLILTGASPAISRDRRVPSSPPRSGNGVIEISTKVASVTPILKACDAPQRAKRRRLVSKTASLVKRLFTDSVESPTWSPACSTREGGRGSQSRPKRRPKRITAQNRIRKPSDGGESARVPLDLCLSAGFLNDGITPTSLTRKRDLNGSVG